MSEMPIMQPADCNVSINGEISWRFADPIFEEIMRDGSNVWWVQIEYWLTEEGDERAMVYGHLTGFNRTGRREATVTITPEDGEPVTVDTGKVVSVVIP